MERMCVLIYEMADQTKKLLHEVLVAYAVRQNVEVEIKWLKHQPAREHIAAACAEAGVAFVSMGDVQTAVRIGQILHQVNPDCALVYYGDQLPENVPDAVRYFSELLPAGPIRYLSRPTREHFAGTICELADAAALRRHFFWDNRGMRYRIPYGSICYFRSDRNHVYLHLTNGAIYSFLGKLASLEKQLPGEMFVRVHQSYLVNRDQIIAVDKQRKCVHLRSGEEVYISKARYSETLEACSPDSRISRTAP